MAIGKNLEFTYRGMTWVYNEHLDEWMCKTSMGTLFITYDIDENRVKQRLITELTIDTVQGSYVVAGLDNAVELAYVIVSKTLEVERIKQYLKAE